MNPMTIMKGQKNLRFVAVPDLAGRADKGKTKYDEHFDRLLANGKEALRMPDDEFDAMKKAMQRYIDNKKLRGKVFVRQRKDRLTRTYLLWFQRKGERV
jgi:hypothetical protein